MSKLKVAVNLFVGIVLGLHFYGNGNSGASTISNAGFFIISITYMGYTTILPAVCSFPAEVKLIKKENFNNWYKLQTYYLASFATTVPSQIIFASSYTIVSYLLTGQPLEMKRFGMFALVMVLVSLASDSCGILFGTMLNPINGTFVGAIYIAYCILMAGFFIQFKDMTPFFFALTSTSIFSYGWKALMYTVYGFGREKLPCPEDFCYLNSAQAIIEEFQLGGVVYLKEIVSLIIILFVMKMAGFYTLKRCVKCS